MEKNVNVTLFFKEENKRICHIRTNDKHARKQTHTNMIKDCRHPETEKRIHSLHHNIIIV